MGVIDLTEAHNPEWMDAIPAFLSLPEEELDAGYSLPLQKAALETGSEL